MWRLLKEPEDRFPTKELAKRIYELPGCPGDRAEKSERVKIYDEELRKSNFSVCIWAVMYCLADKTWYRVNGKHTSKAILNFAGEIPQAGQKIISLRTYEGDELKDASDLYATFDTRESTRSTSDINRAISGTDDDLREIPIFSVTCCAAGISLLLSDFDFNERRISSSERTRRLLENKDFILWLQKTIGNRTKSNAILYRRAVIAAMFDTYRKSPEVSASFWKDVLTGSSPNVNDPTRKLRDFLLERRMTEVEKERETFSKCIFAWNNRIKGVESVSVLKYYKNCDLPRAMACDQNAGVPKLAGVF